MRTSAERMAAAWRDHLSALNPKVLVDVKYRNICMYQVSVLTNFRSASQSMKFKAILPIMNKR